MYPRQARTTLERLARGFPVRALTGPRQSGKTTLARFPDGAILDEVQRCPELLSWLQGLVDEHPVTGQFVPTGSARFDLIAGMNQSLTGWQDVLRH